MSETILGLLRHGQTDWNVEGRLQGTSDIPLNETGLRQAQAAAGAILAAEWDQVLTSPLQRARQTAQQIVYTHALGELKVDDRLLERAFGEAEGLSYLEWKTLYDPAIGVPGGENLEQLELRARAMLSEFAERDGFAVRVMTLPPRRFDVEANVLDSSRLKSEAGWVHKIALKEGIRRIWEHANKSR
jgi:broad specificity phosphatase PhoE